MSILDMLPKAPPDLLEVRSLLGSRRTAKRPSSHGSATNADPSAPAAAAPAEPQPLMEAAAMPAPSASEQTPVEPVPEPLASEEELLQLATLSGQPDALEELQGLTSAEARQKLGKLKAARPKEIRELCQLAKAPNLASEYIEKGFTLQHVRNLLIQHRYDQSSGEHISTHHGPQASGLNPDHSASWARAFAQAGAWRQQQGNQP